MLAVRKGNAMQGASAKDDRPACISEGRPPRVHQAFHPCILREGHAAGAHLAARMLLRPFMLPVRCQPRICRSSLPGNPIHQTAPCSVTRASSACDTGRVITRRLGWLSAACAGAPVLPGAPDAAYRHPVRCLCAVHARAGRTGRWGRAHMLRGLLGALCVACGRPVRHWHSSHAHACSTASVDVGTRCACALRVGVTRVTEI